MNIITTSYGLAPALFFLALFSNTSSNAFRNISKSITCDNLSSGLPSAERFSFVFCVSNKVTDPSLLYFAIGFVIKFNTIPKNQDIYFIVNKLIFRGCLYIIIVVIIIV